MKKLQLQIANETIEKLRKELKHFKDLYNDLSTYASEKIEIIECQDHTIFSMDSQIKFLEKQNTDFDNQIKKLHSQLAEMRIDASASQKRLIASIKDLTLRNDILIEMAEGISLLEKIAQNLPKTL